MEQETRRPGDQNQQTATASRRRSRRRVDKQLIHVMEGGQEACCIHETTNNSSIMKCDIDMLAGFIIVEETQAGCSPDITGPAQLGDTLPHARHQRPAGVPA